MKVLDDETRFQLNREVIAGLVVGSIAINMIEKHMMKHNMFYAAEQNYYYQKKLKDLCNLVLG